MKKWNLVNFCEIDKYSIISYCNIHNVNENLNLGDISKIDLNKLPKNIDIITHGSPCQDFSIAGNLRGGDENSGTRSSLMWCTVGIVDVIKPKIVIWENVKNVLSKKQKHNFDKYISKMNLLGYNSYAQILNAKDYGMPQNRERIFIVSIRKDIDNGKFVFPYPKKLEIVLKDMLEHEVDDKYYLTDEQIQRIEKSNFMATKTRIQKGFVCRTLCARDFRGPVCVELMQLGTVKSKQGKVHQENRIYSQNGLPPTLNACQGGNLQPRIMESETRIRKLTPKEYWRLMGFSDTDFEKAREALNNTFYKGKDKSSSQLYKQAGNSIVVNCTYEIFKELHKAIPEIFDDLNLLSLFSGIGAFEKGLDKLYQEIQ